MLMQFLYRLIEVCRSFASMDVAVEVSYRLLAVRVYKVRTIARGEVRCRREGAERRDGGEESNSLHRCCFRLKSEECLLAHVLRRGMLLSWKSVQDRSSCNREFSH